MGLHAEMIQVTTRAESCAAAWCAEKMRLARLCQRPALVGMASSAPLANAMVTENSVAAEGVPAMVIAAIGNALAKVNVVTVGALARVDVAMAHPDAVAASALAKVDAVMASASATVDTVTVSALAKADAVTANDSARVVAAA